MERKTFEQVLKSSKEINNPSNQNFRMRQFMDEEQFLNYLLSDNLESIHSVLETQQQKISPLPSLVYIQQNHKQLNLSSNIEPDWRIKQFQNKYININDQQTEHTKDTSQNSKVKQTKNTVNFAEKYHLYKKKIDKDISKNQSEQKPIQIEEQQIEVVENLVSNKKSKGLKKLRNILNGKAKIHKRRYKNKSIYKNIVQKVKIQTVKKQQNVQRKRKVRKNLTEQMINILKHHFELVQTNKNHKGANISLKQIANMINIGYSTTLQKYREYRQSGQISKGILLKCKQAPRKYNKSVIIQEHIKKALEMRDVFRTHQQLADFVFNQFGLKISRSIVSRHFNIILNQKNERKIKENETYQSEQKRQEEMRQ